MCFEQIEHTCHCRHGNVSILSILLLDTLSNQKGRMLESRKDDNLFPPLNPTMNDTSTLLFLYWKHDTIQNEESNSE